MPKDKHILVTGGTGFVGSYLLRYLLDQGYHRIRAIKRKHSTMDLVSDDLIDHIEWIDCDILDIVGLEDSIRGVDQVYHSAAMVSFQPSERKMMRKVNIEGTANIVNVALHEGVKKLVHVSSIAAIGRKKPGETISEESQWESSPYNTQYAVSKYLSEREIWRGIAEGLQACIINPSMILGAGRWNDGPQKFFKLVWDGLSFFPLGANGFVDVRDVAKMMVQLMESDITGRRFIASSENLSYHQLIDTIAGHLGKKTPELALHNALTEFLWRWEWWKAKLTGNPPAVTKETARHTSRKFYYDNTRSKKELNFEYLPVEKTISDIAPAFLEATRHNFESRIFEFV